MAITDGTIPHFAFPFVIGASGANTVEQSTDEEILACVNAILVCPIGTRAVNADFGITWPLYEQAPVDAATMISEINLWEPRAVITASEYADPNSQDFRHVQLIITPND
jgi:phage baseplate assembly protein W